MTSTPSATRRVLRDTFRTQLWPIPTLAVVAAVASGLLLPRLDAAVDSHISGWLDAVLFGGDANSASTVLDAVASSQYSPRLLRTFTQDLVVQVTLAVFLATFAYALTVLRSVRGAGEADAGFTPRIAVTTAYVLAVVSVLALVLFLAHLTRQIRVETILAQVRQDAEATVRGALPEIGHDLPSQLPSPTGCPLRAATSGFLIHVDTDRLLDASRAGGAMVVVTALVGDFIVQGTPAGFLTAAAGQEQASPEQINNADRLFGEALHTGTERTAAQDVGFGLRQLTDVAVKALSPGINDPTTAVHAIGHLSALLCLLTGRDLGPVTVTSSDGARVVLNRPTLDHLLEPSLTQIRGYGATDPLVLARLYRLLSELGWHVSEPDRALLDRERRRLDTVVQTSDFDDVIRNGLAQLSQDVRSAPQRRLSPPTPSTEQHQ